MLQLLRCSGRYKSSATLYCSLEITRRFHASQCVCEVAKPISHDEFKRHLQQCMPTQSQGENIAVAFSGGPDSTCLLYHLKHLTDNNVFGDHKQTEAVAVTIDHRLQAASSQMSEKCASIAASLKVKHLVYKIPWGVAPFPSIPSSGAPFENIAREARYHQLLSAMRNEAISTIAFGHHADDQVETALLRIARGSTEVGLAGMRPRRLWGMGFGTGPENLGWAGQDGMSRWIIRPLLGFPKERLIATCQSAGLEYVVDKTNFQPDVALRNQVRRELGSPGSLAERTKVLLDIAAGVATSDDRAQQVQVTHQEDGPTSLAQLRSAIESVSDFVDRLNHEASIQLEKCLRSSPPSTILLSKDTFSRVTDRSVRFEIIRRVLRFVSPFPWGSIRAEAGRRTDSLQRISDTLIGTRECSTKRSNKDCPSVIPDRKFVAGGGVVWTPVYITHDAKMKFTGKGKSIFKELGWLASRQSPIRRYGDSAAKSLELDITKSIYTALSQGRSLEILYDNRF
ncbi:uncharacterized protein FOMMEDRAFT_141347, partial [Fomitiporia mediterranea MF3/22]|uniref:uncharacterized protein n=1 Tax=Fomitiporia mediterranea (strain MF3/22) TaxID=694068 RepID=UPI0004407976